MTQIQQRTREMAVSHADFMRLLPHAMPGFACTAHGNRISAAAGQQRVEIKMGAESERRIAMLRIPVTEVTLELHGFDTEQTQAFLQKFDMTYQRGGG